MKSAPPVISQPKAKLIQRVLHASGWTMFGFGSGQLLRLGGNLILTRLLFPEAFGLMAIVQAVITGVAMLSDVGIAQSIIKAKRGNEPAFVNTAWTMQVIRGVLMWLVLWLLSEPIAIIYGDPTLAGLLPAVGLAAIIAGLSSTNLATAERNLTIAKVTFIELGTAILGLVVTIALAWLDPSVWSLVVGNIVGAATKTLASHFLLAGIRNQFAWERASLSSLFTFGKWIFVSSALTFLVGEGSRLLIGNFLDVRMLAFFSLAMAMDQLPRQIALQLGARVLFPAFSEVVNERPERLYAVVQKSRIALIAPFWLVSALLAYVGPAMMEVLYDPRYHDAGWMLQLLALGSLTSGLGISYGPILWAKGAMRTHTALLATQFGVQSAAMIIGFYIAGPKGLIIGIAAVSWLMYPAYVFVYSRLHLWQPKIDLPVLGASLLVTIFILSVPQFAWPIR